MAMLTIRSFQTAKDGNRPDECEDASRIRLSGEGPARLAMCDGASESAFARPWAQILAESLVMRPLDLDGLDGPALTEWLEPCVDQWKGVVPWGRIPWHGQAKTRAGSMATFLGMTVDWAPGPSGALPWQAAAVGDCCLFIVRDDALDISFPMEESSQFNTTPPLVCSNPANNNGLLSHVRQLQGNCLPGDLIFLASDALACWILQESESGSRPWETLLSLETKKEWSNWVQSRRGERAMRNDDTTMITVKVE
jgi:hypothetical protein